MNCRFLYMYFRLVLPCNWSIWKGAHVNTSQIDFLCDFKLKVWVKMFNKGFAEKNTDSITLVLMLCFPMKERQLRMIILGYMYSFDTIHTKFIWLQEMITFNQVRDNEFGPFTLVSRPSTSNLKYSSIANVWLAHLVFFVPGTI